MLRCVVSWTNDCQILGKSGPVVPTATETLGLAKTVTKSGITLNPLGNTVGGFKVSAPAKLSARVVPAQVVTAAPPTTITVAQPSIIAKRVRRDHIARSTGCSNRTDSCDGSRILHRKRDSERKEVEDKEVTVRD